MTPLTQNVLFNRIRKIVSITILVAFVTTSIRTTNSYAQMPAMPQPGVMVHLSPEFTPAHLKGVIIHPEDILKFDFIVNKGDEFQTADNRPEALDKKKETYTKLIKYFLASLAVPDENQWVNLSPYEKDRIIKDDFGKTEMGRDLLAQDYLLKQITASLIYPKDEIGKKFWDKVYAQAQAQFGTSNIPVNTFNKVWIVPDDAQVYEKGNAVFLISSHLKVMLEEDYLSLNKHEALNPKFETNSNVSMNKNLKRFGNSNLENSNIISNIRELENSNINKIGSQIVREVVLPALEKEVNEGQNFAPLRQVFSGMILAAWYKRALKESLLSKIYVNKAKVKGVDTDPKTNEAIYQQYLDAYKKGVFNFIKEDVDKYTNQPMPRKYFSGGSKLGDVTMFSRIISPDEANRAMTSEAIKDEIVRAAMTTGDKAMLTQSWFKYQKPNNDQGKVKLEPQFDDASFQSAVLGVIALDNPELEITLRLSNDLQGSNPIEVKVSGEESFGTLYDLLNRHKFCSFEIVSKEDNQSPTSLINVHRVSGEILNVLTGQTFSSYFKEPAFSNDSTKIIKSLSIKAPVSENISENTDINKMFDSLMNLGQWGKFKDYHLKFKFIDTDFPKDFIELNSQNREAIIDIINKSKGRRVAIEIEYPITLEPKKGYTDYHTDEIPMMSYLGIVMNILRGNKVNEDGTIQRSKGEDVPKSTGDSAMLKIETFRELLEIDPRQLVFIDSLLSQYNLKLVPLEQGSNEVKNAKTLSISFEGKYENTKVKIRTKEGFKQEKNKFYFKIELEDNNLPSGSELLGVYLEIPEIEKDLIQRTLSMEFSKFYGKISSIKDWLAKFNLAIRKVDNTGLDMNTLLKANSNTALSLKGEIVKLTRKTLGDLYVIVPKEGLPTLQVTTAWLSLILIVVEEPHQKGDRAQRANTDREKFTRGGIDLNSANLNLQIKRDSNGVPLPLAQQDLENIRIDGLIPVILDIKPIAQTPLLGQLTATSGV